MKGSRVDGKHLSQQNVRSKTGIVNTSSSVSSQAFNSTIVNNAAIGQVPANSGQSLIPGRQTESSMPPPRPMSPVASHTSALQTQNHSPNTTQINPESSTSVQINPSTSWSTNIDVAPMHQGPKVNTVSSKSASRPPDYTAF